MTDFFWIVEYVASFMEFFICGIFCGTFLTKEKLGDRKYLLFLGSGVGAVFVIVLNRISIFSYINSILITLIAFLLQVFVYRTKAMLSFLLTLMYTVILAAVDFTIAYFTAFLLDTDAGYILNTQSMSRVLCILMSKSILLLIVGTFSRLLSNSLVFLKKYVVIMCIYSVFLLVSLFIMVELNINSENSETEIFLTIFFVASIIIELLMFYFVIKTGEGYEQKQEAELIEMKNRMLQKSLDETEQAFELWRSSVHDYKNNIIALRQLASEGNMEGIREYLDCESELLDKKMFYIRTGCSVVDTIVNTKQGLAEKKGITFVVNASIPEKHNIRELDMANILGNLLDNAIEASEGEAEPYIDLTLRQEKTFILIKVINKYSRDLSKKLETTKNQKLFHGIGIGSVKSVLKEYEGEFSIEKSGDEVVAKAMIPN